MIRERPASAAAGGLMLALIVLIVLGSVFWLVLAARMGFAPGVILALLGLAAGALGCVGLFAVYPNDAKVITFVGSYTGTVREPGFWWVNPFSLKKRVSLRVRNFESAKLKVNDHAGNPIEIAAVIVWRIVDTAEAVFQVDNCDNYVHVQSEAAIRNLATSYPYDAHQEGEISLRSNTGEVADQLKVELTERLSKAGVEVIEARISHLAYAPEIASAMLQRQQASAIIAARTKIVEGAVSMVEMALARLAEHDTVTLDEERKAAMVSNLLVVLCSDRHAQPVVNTGSLYT
jgi:regulator of protease activity HflC (stomatin/prohibitin superfamily)